jgi:F0F1-type ATP synthase assembly protein I
MTDMAEQQKPPPGKSSMMEVMRAMNPYKDIGMTFVVTIGGGAWLGYWADQRWGTAPWLLFVGAVLGIAVGFYHFFAVVLRK